MKKSIIAVFMVALVMFNLCSCSRSFDAYYYTTEQAIANDSKLKGAEHLSTIENGQSYFSVLLCGK